MRLILEVIFLTPMLWFILIALGSFAVTAVWEWLDDRPEDDRTVSQFERSRRVLERSRRSH